MKKICFVATIGLSIRSFFVPQLKYLAENGYDVTVVCSYEDGIQELVGNKVRYCPIEIPRGVSFFGMIKAINKLKKFFSEEQFDLVQYSTPNAGLCAAIASKRCRVPVRNYHLMGLRYLGDAGMKRNLLKIFEKITCRLSTDIECVSRSNLDMAIKEKLFLAEKGTIVFHGSTGGIDIQRFNADLREMYRSQIRLDLGIDADDFIYGFVGRVTRDKGINEILMAYDKVHKGKLIFVGFLDEVDTLDDALYEASRHNENIIYTGPVNDVEKYYAAIDCLLLPSYREGFGNVVIEAAAMGTPAIVSRIPGPIDASVEGVTALWVEPNDVDDLAEAMKSMTECAKDMQKDCIEFARDNFDQEKLNREILRRKNELLGI